MKKALVLVVVSLGIGGAFAWHHPCPPPPPHYYHHYGYSGRGWAAVGVGFAAGVVGAALYNAVAPRETVVVQQPAPVIVQQPVVVQQPTPIVVQQAPAVVQQPVTVAAPRQQVWVPGRYVQQIQANGAAVTVWQPGHYE